MTTHIITLDYYPEFIDRVLDAVRIEAERRRAVVLARECRHVPTEFEMDALHRMIEWASEFDNPGKTFTLLDILDEPVDEREADAAEAATVAALWDEPADVGTATAAVYGVHYELDPRTAEQIDRDVEAAEWRETYNDLRAGL